MILFQDQLVDRDDVKVDIEDRGYQFGDGVYEVIRIYGGKIFALNEHLKRLERSAGELHIELPFSAKCIGEKLQQLVKEDQVGDGNIYLQVTRGIAPRNHPFPEKSEAVFVAYTKVAERPLEKMKSGAHVLLSEDIRWLRCDIKSLNLLGNVLGKQKAIENGCDETVFHRNGTVTEGSSSNMYIVNGNTIQTHPANNLILNGITRAYVVKLAEKLGLSFNEEPFSTEDLLNAEEAFFTSTTAEIMPIVKIDDTIISNGNPGTNTVKLQNAFEEIIA